jgi:hypothetical protein
MLFHSALPGVTQPVISKIKPALAAIQSVLIIGYLHISHLDFKLLHWERSNRSVVT